MNMIKDSTIELETILDELKFNISVEQIPTTEQSAILEFLTKERSARLTKRLERLLAMSGMAKHQIRTFEQIDWNFNPKIPKHDIQAFRSSKWIEQAANIVLIGNPGIGKSHIAKALCYDAIQRGFQAYFTSAFDLISKIKKLPNPASRIDFYGKALKILCIDEFGYTIYKPEDNDILFQILSKRSELHPTIITSNLRPKQWGSFLSASAASTILDRLSFNGKFLLWDGPSYRGSFDS